MLVSLMNMLLFMISGFILMYAVYRPQVDKYMQTLKLTLPMMPIFYIFALYAVSCAVAYFFAGDADFVESLTLARVLIPLACAVLIYVAFGVFDEPGFCITVAAAVALTVWLQPADIGMPFEQLPPYVVRLAAFALGTAFCLGMRILNILPHTVVIPLITVLLGVCVLCFVGAAPAFIALCAAGLVGIMAAYLTLNYYEVKIELDDGSCVVLAYLVCNLLLMNLGEFCFPSCIIFTMFLWAEIVTAFWQRFMETHSGLLRENTNYYRSANVFTIQELSMSILRICVVLLFIGWFQLFSVNQYSLLIVSFCLALWLNNVSGRRSPTTIKEINKEFMAEFKQNLEETKNLLTRSKKDEE